MRVKQGKIVSNKMDKTVSVEVHAYKTDPKYLKRFRVTNKFYAHDPENKAQIGQEVIIAETPPKSKTKRWKIIEFIK